MSNNANANSLFAERSARLNTALVIVGVFTILLVGWQAWETRKAAQATKASAEVAERSLRLLNQPWLDTSDWNVSERRGATVVSEDGCPSQPLIGLIVTFNVVNNSQTPATLYSLELTDYGSGSPPDDWTVTAGVGNLITPGAKYPCQAEITDMTRWQIDQYESGEGFTITVNGVIHFGDLFTEKRSHENAVGPRQRHFGRTCVLRFRGSEFRPIADAERVVPDYGDHSDQDEP